jgi:hypothetical protein
VYLYPFLIVKARMARLIGSIGKLRLIQVSTALGLGLGLLVSSDKSHFIA